MGLDEFDSISEWIVDENALTSLQRFILPHAVSVIVQPFDERWQIFHDQRRVCLARRPEILLDAKMNLQTAVFKPTSTSPCKVRRFVDLGNSEDLAVELACSAFATGRQRQLYVVNSGDAHGTKSLTVRQLVRTASVQTPI